MKPRAGHVEQEPHRSPDLLERSSHLVLPGDVAGDPSDSAPQPPEPGLRLADPVRVPADDRHREAGGAQPLGEGEPQPRAPARHGRRRCRLASPARVLLTIGPLDNVSPPMLGSGLTTLSESGGPEAGWVTDPRWSTSPGSRV